MRVVLAVVMVAVAAVAAVRGQGETFDLVIRGGRVVDGTGNPAFDADLGIRDGRIAALGRVAGVAGRVIDATGLVVSPGFIDVHNHSDTTLLDDPDAQSMVRQGVTSLILGEGGSAAPSARWPRFRDYFGELQRRGLSVNVGSYVGSGQVWTEVRGPRAGPPEARELETMRRLVGEAMADGALGLASSLSGPPGVWIDTDTLVALAEVAGQHGGIYSTHMRTEGKGVFASVEEAIEIGRRARLPVDIIHLKIAEHTMWGRMPELIALISGARVRGQLVEANVYPYRAGQNNLASIVPPWAHEGGTAALIARLKNPALRPRLEAEILGTAPTGDWYNHYTATGDWDGMLLVTLSNPRYQRFAGMRMNEVITALGKPPLDVLFELLVENDGSVPTVYFHHSEEDMRHALAQPFVSIGSDGSAVNTDGTVGPTHPHPRFYGTFPRVLGRYVREARVLTLEDAVRKMTSANAAKVRQFDRGLLRPGMRADVTIFDAARIVDRATYEQPRQYAEGIAYVVVNGTVVLDRGEHTHARPGTVLRSRAKAGSDQEPAR
ncbi:amidohydrolase family protein [Luteitalea sp. TBR-22]|uniref:N-acyl-D-amino-acid deacylase family protein n=1 Tax=Luteitalea sp. TBR-22 TaxID=2802971 RepID=UPI001EF7037B|nr:D-aminoacylase [Luteitalea sp. TBR-22]